MDRVADYLRNGRERGALLLVPTLSQASHVKRLFLSRGADLPGFFDESVVTFTSLAERVLPDRRIGELLSGLRQDLLLRRVLFEAAPPAFRRLARFPGFRARALAFLKEVKQNGRETSESERRLAEMASEAPPAVRERLEGLRRVYHAYEAARETAGLLDHEDSLRLARDELEAGRSSIDLRLLAVDGFQNFTSLERDLLRQVARRADETIVTLPWDPALDADEGGHFRVASETRAFLLDRGFVPEFIEGNRRARSPDLARLERDLFRPDAPVRPAEGGLRALEAADPLDEADRVARTVVRLVRGDFGRAYRYRDVAVVVREVSGREERFRAAFERHGIPLRIYGPVPLAGHPYVRAVGNLLELAAGRFEPRPVLDLLRADHTAGVPATAVDRLEHDLAEHGAPVAARDWVERAAAFSPEAGELLASLARFDRSPRTGPDWHGTLTDLADACLTPLFTRDESDVERVRRDARALAEFRNAAAEVARAQAGVVAFEEIAGLLREVLRASSAGARDRRLEVVNLIGAREARQWEAPVVIVAGLLEGEFPRAPREDLFVPDDERRRANEDGVLALRERSLDREEERYLFYVAMTRARELLFLSWPATDGGGRETLRSLYLEEVFERFGGEEGILTRRRLSDALPRADEIVDAGDLHRRALLGLATPCFERGGKGTAAEAASGTAAALADRLLESGDAVFARAAARGARFRGSRRAVLSDPSIVRAGRYSATALEDFAACPFRHFAARTLRLSPAPAAAGLDGRLLGNIAHEVLHRLFAPAAAGGDLPDPSLVAGLVDEEFTAQAASIPIGLAEGRARDVMVRALEETVARERARLAAGPWRPTRLEDGFGGGDAALTVPGPDGEPIVLRGRVDRVDEDGRGGAVVIDYKYSRKGFTPAKQKDAEEGAHLQLPVYLLALRDAYGVKPRGAWLYPILSQKTGGYSIEGGPVAAEGVGLDADGLDELLERTVETVVAYDARIRAGEIDVRPRDPSVCEWCDFADLCRYESWMAEDGE